VKYYAVCPGGLLTVLPRETRHHLVLSNQVLSDGRYAIYFSTVRRNGAFANGDTTGGLRVILDNPVHERLEVPSLLERMEALRAVKASAVVAPDCIGDPTESLRLLRIHMRSTLGRSSATETIAVVQGKSSDDYLAHIQQLAKMVSYIGIPQIRVPGVSFSRYEFICMLRDLKFFERNPHVKIHLLGNIGLFQDAICLSDVPQVVGIDSAKPIYLGAMGIDIRDFQASITARRPSNFFDLLTAQLTPDQEELIRQNIRTVREWVGDV